jgi:hypothetical protein
MKFQPLKGFLDAAERLAGVSKVTEFKRAARKAVEVGKIANVGIRGDECIPFLNSFRKLVKKFTE